MAKTIKEIADELGVSKTAVSKQTLVCDQVCEKTETSLRSKTNKKS